MNHRAAVDAMLEKLGECIAERDELRTDLMGAQIENQILIEQVADKSEQIHQLQVTVEDLRGKEHR